MKVNKSRTITDAAEREKSASLLALCRAARRKTSKAKLIALFAAMALMMTVEGRAAPSEGYDALFTVYVNGSDSWTPFPGKSGVSFSNSDNNALSVRDNGAKADFTGKQVGVAVITATLGSEVKRAQVWIRAMETGETGGSGKPDEESGTVVAGSKYITYNKPVNAYYIEYNGGYIDANKKPRPGLLVEAYDNKEYMRIGDTYDSENGIYNIYFIPSGNWYFRWSNYGDGYWFIDYESKHSDGSGWQNKEYKRRIYPLSQFAAFSTGVNNSDLSAVAENSLYSLPVKKDITRYYVRSERVLGIMCDVFNYVQKIDGIPYSVTWWVDPARGFTLKMKSTEGEKIITDWTVTKLIIGSPDWDGLHLHPLKGDTEDYDGVRRTF